MGIKAEVFFVKKRISDVIDCAKINSNKLLHPTEKPISLLETFIKNSSDKENIIFDGFSGSGTTAIACINTGRSFIGFEMDKDYFDIATKRIEGHSMILT